MHQTTWCRVCTLSPSPLYHVVNLKLNKVLLLIIWVLSVLYVSDIEAPVVTAPNNIRARNVDSGSATATVTWSPLLPSAYDSFQGVIDSTTIICRTADATVVVSGSAFPVGTSLVTCTAADASGNEGMDQFTIMVVGRWIFFLRPMICRFMWSFLWFVIFLFANVLLMFTISRWIFVEHLFTYLCIFSRTRPFNELWILTIPYIEMLWLVFGSTLSTMLVLCANKLP